VFDPSACLHEQKHTNQCWVLRLFAMDQMLHVQKIANRSHRGRWNANVTTASQRHQSMADQSDQLAFDPWCRAWGLIQQHVTTSVAQCCATTDCPWETLLDTKTFAVCTSDPKSAWLLMIETLDSHAWLASSRSKEFALRVTSHRNRAWWTRSLFVSSMSVNG